MTDAHNHLQQFADPVKVLSQASGSGVTRMLVNGTSEHDWPQVADLAATHPQVLSSFGLHPWHVPDRSPDWLTTLRQHLTQNPQAAIGECGLDRWKKPFDLPDQLTCLQAQLDLANELQRPLTIHCLQAWGPLLEILQKQTTLQPFLLHAYSGSTEMVAPLAKLGAYFSFSGYFLHERKASVRETFRHIPSDRLLLETDAPAMLPPAEFQSEKNHPINLNHPANLTNFLKPLATLLNKEETTLITQLEENFQTFIPPKRPLSGSHSPARP